MDQPSRTELHEMGEFGLIKHLTSSIKLVNASTIKGVGDDAAVLDHGSKQTVVTTDLLTEQVHFDLMYTPLKHLGYKAVIVNLSDVFAMNAMPEQITVSLAVSNRFSVEGLEELYSGMLLACSQYGVDLVGGDTTSSVSGLTISITALGTVNKEKVVYRSGAKEHDLICVSGDLGAAYIGLQYLEREKEVFKENDKIQPDLEGKDYVLERILKPEARKDVIEELEKQGVVPTAMMDISDGLASELIHICDQSEVGCRIYQDKVPIDPVTVSLAEELRLEPLIAALSGGEDYELLFTVSMDDFEKVKAMPQVKVIGHITEKNQGHRLVSNSGSEVELTAQGWDQFLSAKKD